ncbi:MAG: redoxin domain-containing protein [Pseudomonadales bacterium]|nr:redoxin domain-containing protein [Pseudomonadales bacterium]
MNGLKSKFITLYVTALMIAVVHAGVAIFGGVADEYLMAWLGAAFATGPQLAFFMKIFFVSTARTSANLNTLVMLGMVGAATAAVSVSQTEMIDWLPLFYAIVIGMGGNLLYVFWYSRFGRGDNLLLQVGKKLPKFTLEDQRKNEIKSNAFLGSPCLIIFYRGNWCPLCMAQIKEVAGQYKAMADRGVKVVLVSPQSHKNTESLAKKFDVPFLFLVDKNNKAAEKLNIISAGGTPAGLEVLGYDSDTVMPTVLMTDAKGKIIFADLTDNYRVRPEPETFIKVWEENGITISEN